MHKLPLDPKSSVYDSDTHLITLVTYCWWLTFATLTIPRTETKPWIHNLLTLRAFFLNYQNEQVSFLFCYPARSTTLPNCTPLLIYNTPKKKKKNQRPPLYNQGKVWVWLGYDSITWLGYFLKVTLSCISVVLIKGDVCSLLFNQTHFDDSDTSRTFHLFLSFTLGTDSRQRKHLPHQATSYILHYITLHISKINSSRVSQKYWGQTTLTKHSSLKKKSWARDFQSSNTENWKRTSFLHLYTPLHALQNTNKLMIFSSCHSFFAEDNYRYHSPCSTKHIIVTAKHSITTREHSDESTYTYRSLFLNAVCVVNVDVWQPTDLTLHERIFLDSLHVLKSVDLADKTNADTNFLSL